MRLVSITEEIMNQTDSPPRELFESERSFRMLVDAVTDYAVYMLDHDGYITSWNAGGQRIKGYLPKEIIGQHFSRFYTEADRANGKPKRALKTAAQTGRYEEEGWRVRKDGTFFWASVVIDPILEDGQLVGFAKVTRDISERREAQLRLEEIQKKLAESQKLDALGQLTGGVAHDFNNLLMIITGSINVLRRVAGTDAKGQRAIQAIEAAAHRGASLTRQLLTFARRQSVTPQTVNLSELVSNVRDVLHTGIGSTVQLSIEAEQDLWPVTLDVGEFETALVNIVINARDAMPNGGPIDLVLTNCTVREVDLAGDFVAVSISDTGVGIPDDIATKVFDPFFTTKPIGKGTGLGLSQVHGFAHQAGGFVKIRSKLSEGTTVTLYLPRAEEVNEVNGKETAEEEAATAGIGTVLLVEDNPDVASVSKALLEQLGYRVRCASNANTAMDEIARDGIDLLFTDIVMPGQMDGLALAREVRKIRPDMRILLATGYSEAIAKAPSEFPILHKPYQIHELSSALGRL
jgi:PAS domain S-box-containing protein